MWKGRYNNVLFWEPNAAVWVIRGVEVSENICDNTMKQQNKFFHNECIQKGRYPYTRDTLAVSAVRCRIWCRSSSCFEIDLGLFQAIFHAKIEHSLGKPNRKIQLDSNKSYEWRNTLVLFHKIIKLRVLNSQDFCAGMTERAARGTGRRDGHLACGLFGGLYFCIPEKISSIKNSNL